jgi:SAM-dependent methyltransferase
MSDALFDLSEKYEAMLQQGLQLSGEDQHFFIAGRVRDLCGQLPAGWTPRRVLDFGCGVGHAAGRLAAEFPEAEILGIDTSAPALERASQVYASPRISFRPLDGFAEENAFDLCYVNGVFHHIEPEARVGAIQMIYKALRPGGYLAFFENNPWNPGTRLVMRRIPFDRDAKTVSPMAAWRLVGAGGFPKRLSARFLFYFPHALRFLRFTESWLARLPLGAQYYVLAQK